MRFIINGFKKVHVCIVDKVGAGRRWLPDQRDGAIAGDGMTVEIGAVGDPYIYPGSLGTAVEGAVPSFGRIGGEEDALTGTIVDREIPEALQPQGDDVKDIVMPVPIRGEGIGYEDADP